MNVMSFFTAIPQNIFLTISGLLGIGFIIAFHELGHFLFCKLFNIRTPSFSIGFGPRIISKKIGETEFAISAIPLGGYVEIAGSSEVGQGDQTEAHATDDRSFARKPWIQKFMVMIGGILFNLIFAYSTLILLYLIGMPKTMLLYPENSTPTVQMIQPDSPAEQAGIQAEDTITAINETPLTNSAQPAVELIRNSPHKTIQLTVKRDGAEKNVSLETLSGSFLGTKIGTSGIIFAITELTPATSISDAVNKGIKFANTNIKNTWNAFTHMFSKKDTSMVAGPIRIISETAKSTQQGIRPLLLFLAIISISLAILNLLPLPILDGGQILFYTIEAIIGRSIPEKIKEYIHIACWIAFMILAAYLSFKDIRHIAHPYIEKITEFLGWGG